MIGLFLILIIKKDERESNLNFEFFLIEMKTAIIVSKKDIAGMNVREFLEREDLKTLDAKLYVIEEDSIHAENLDREIHADLFIFATRHSSKQGIHCLSCHAPGNWGKAEAGGGERRLCIAPAIYLKEIFLLLNKMNVLEDFETTLECTHHGPYLEKPCFFVEIGSNEEEWGNKKAGAIVANVIIVFLRKLKEGFKGYEIGFGIGGTHYASTFNRKLINKDIALGHICPKYMLKSLDKEMILQAMEKTLPKADFVLLDWKGLGEEKKRIMKLLNDLIIKFKRADQLKQKFYI
jgi:D-aminoacyl-tRNA deacylase